MRRLAAAHAHTPQTWAQIRNAGKPVSQSHVVHLAYTVCLRSLHVLLLPAIFSRLHFVRVCSVSDPCLPKKKENLMRSEINLSLARTASPMLSVCGLKTERTTGRMRKVEK